MARLELLGRHVREAPAEIGGRRRAGDLVAEADVEIGQFGRPFGRDQDVGRFHIAMEHAEPMGIVQGPGQFRPQPANRLGPACAGEPGPRGRFARPRFAPPLERFVDDVEQQFPGPLLRRGSPYALNHRLQCSAGDVLHIEQAELAVRNRPLVIHADDVVVVELGQRLGFVTPVGRHFEGDEPLHRLLAGEKHLGERAGTQLEEQIEILDRVSRTHLDKPALLGAFVQRRRFVVLFDPQQGRDLGRLMRKRLEIFFRRNVLAGLFADMEFFVDEVARDSPLAKLGQFGEVLEKPLGTAPVEPTVFEINLNQLDERETANLTRLRQERPEIGGCR